MITIKPWQSILTKCDFLPRKNNAKFSIIYDNIILVDFQNIFKQMFMEWNGFYWWDGRDLILWLFVGPTGVYLLDFFFSGIQFNKLLSPYPCFMSLLYLDLYVFGNNALIS